MSDEMVYKVDCYRCPLFRTTPDREEAEKIRDEHEHRYAEVTPIKKVTS